MNALPAPIPAVLELFATSLADVRFADLDAGVLTRLAAEVEAAAALVSSEQAALDAARATLTEKQEALMQSVQRAVAYARVYAESDAELSARLSALALPRAAAPRAARRPRAPVVAAEASDPAPAAESAPSGAETVAALPDVAASEADEVVNPPRKGKRRETVRTVSAVD